MQELLERCCGLDVHKETVVACIMTGGGKKMHKETKTFGTMTKDLRALLQWIKENNIKHVAMESTGVYWVPIFNVLEEYTELKIFLANARHVKNVPGRKTDMRDAEWLCKLLKSGLVEKSFIPQASLRNLRMLMRYRRSLTCNLSAAKNRVLKILESANIKLSSVLSDTYGVSGWKIIRAITNGESNPEKLLQYIDHQVRASKEEIKKALTGTLNSEHMQILKFMIRHIDDLEKLISDIELQIKENAQKYSSDIELLRTIPGISDLVATTIVAEMGVDMKQFPSDKHLASWAGLAPSNNESAGKKKSSSITEGNRHLKIVIVQAAWAAVRKKNTFWHATYNRLRNRLGPKKALIAIAHKIVVCAYWVLKNRMPYNELGANLADQKVRSRRAKYHAKQLESLGFKVHLENLQKQDHIHRQ